MNYVADFETTNKRYYDKYGFTTINWFGITPLSEDDDTRYEGTTIVDFIDTIKLLGSTSTIFFHNGAAFDFHFILSYLIYKGFPREEDRKEFKTKKSWKAIIDNNKKILSLSVNFGKLRGIRRIVHFKDSYSWLTSGIKTISKVLGIKHEALTEEEYDVEPNIPIETLKKDYKVFYEYAWRDVIVLKKALLSYTNKIVPIEDFKITGTGTIFKSVQVWFNKKNGTGSWGKHFPKIERELWLELYKSYWGGFTYVNPKFAFKKLKNVVVIDENSMYPHKYLYEPMPYGKPCKGDCGDKYPLKIYRIHQTTDLVAKTIPFVSIKGVGSGERVRKIPKIFDYDIQIPSPLIELFRENYKGNWTEEVLYSFKAKQGVFFNEYFDKYRKIKEEATEPITRKQAKLPQNSFYGKFAQNIDFKGKTPNIEFDDKEGIVWEQTEEPANSGNYIPIAIFTTAYSRADLVRLNLKAIDNLVYNDTDSVHFVGLSEEEVKEKMGDIFHETEYGKYKIEGVWEEAVYRNKKQYYHLNNLPNGDKEIEIAFAGVTNPAKKVGNIDNFIGKGKDHLLEINDASLALTSVKGGRILYPVNKKYKDTLTKWE